MKLCYFSSQQQPKKNSLLVSLYIFSHRLPVSKFSLHNLWNHSRLDRKDGNKSGLSLQLGPTIKNKKRHIMSHMLKRETAIDPENLTTDHIDYLTTRNEPCEMLVIKSQNGEPNINTDIWEKTHTHTHQSLCVFVLLVSRHSSQMCFESVLLWSRRWHWGGHGTEENFVTQLFKHLSCGTSSISVSERFFFLTCYIIFFFLREAPKKCQATKNTSRPASGGLQRLSEAAATRPKLVLRFLFAFELINSTYRELVWGSSQQTHSWDIITALERKEFLCAMLMFLLFIFLLLKAFLYSSLLL